jgi:hypothetical protein
MSPDDYQQAWQAQASQTRVTIDADLLLKELRRDQQSFQTTFLSRDFGEVALALLMLPLWFYLGATLALPWTWYLMVPTMLWHAGFMVMYRRRHKEKPAEAGSPLLDCAMNSLTQVETQIWLNTNVFLWGILPTSIASLAFIGHVGWLTSIEWWATLGIMGFIVPVMGSLYFLNQYAVRKRFEPRRQELLRLIASLEGDTAGVVGGDYPRLMSVEYGTFSRRNLLIRRLCGGVLLFASVGVIVFLARLDLGYPKKSPFAAVRWQETQPEVKVGDEWFKLVSLDKISADEIVGFSQRTYRDKWRKRFEEDLVELLSGMGHPPKDTVTLVVQSLTSSEKRVLENVPMTSGNRRAIRDAAQEREQSGQPQASQTDRLTHDGKDSIKDLITDLPSSSPR